MLNPVTTATNSQAPALTLEMVVQSYQRLKSKIGQSHESPVYKAYVQAFGVEAKRRYALRLGVEKLSAEQEKEMWDEMSHAWARYVGLEDAEGNLL